MLQQKKYQQLAEVEAPPAVPEEFQPRRPNVELCAFCQCPNVPDEEARADGQNELHSFMASPLSLRMDGR